MQTGDLVIREADSGQLLPAIVQEVGADTVRVRVFSDSAEDVWTEHDEPPHMLHEPTDEHRTGRVGELFARASVSAATRPE